MVAGLLAFRPDLLNDSLNSKPFFSCCIYKQAIPYVAVFLHTVLVAGCSPTFFVCFYLNSFLLARSYRVLSAKTVVLIWKHGFNTAQSLFVYLHTSLGTASIYQFNLFKECYTNLEPQVVTSSYNFFKSENQRSGFFISCEKCCTLLSFCPCQKLSHDLF